MSEAVYWVYILHCDNDTYYTGYTTDIVRRLKEHKAGTATCKYTRSFKPLSLAQCWETTEDKSTAMKIEKYIKNFSKQDKIRLITLPALLCEKFPCEAVEQSFL